MEFHKISKNKFIKNVLILSSGALGAQLINMLGMPFVTRLYGPEAYGLMSSFMAILNIIIPLAALTYPISIVLPKSEKEAMGLSRLSLNVVFLISFISLIILILFKSDIVQLFNLQEISSYLLIIPLAIIFSGLMQIHEQWFIRKNAFKINAKAAFFQSVFTNTGAIGIGLISPIAPVLVILHSLKTGTITLLMILFSWKNNVNPPNFKRNEYNLKSLAKKYYDFPIYRAPITLLNEVSQSLPLLMLASFFGPASVGFYAIGRTVLSIPSQLISKAVGDVYYPKIAEDINANRKITNSLIKTTSILALIGLLPFGIVIIFGPSLFAFAFGEEWRMGGEYARLISIWAFFGFINQPSVRALPVLNAQKFHLYFSIVMLIARVGALTVGFTVFNDDLIAVALFSIVGAILNVILILASIVISIKFHSSRIL